MKRKEAHIQKWSPSPAIPNLYHVPSSKSVLARDIILMHRLGVSVDEIRRKFFRFQRGGEDLGDDISVLLDALSSPYRHDCGESGTVLRFLTAYLSSKKGEHLITGSPRLKERPIKDLCRILEASGVRFTFLEKEYAAPFVITNPIGDLTYPAEIDARDFPSSQFLSALLLAGCSSSFLFDDNFPSLPYFRLTASRLDRYGSDWDRIGDWSSAWYWIEHLLLQPGSDDLTVAGLSLKSGQPDEALYHEVKDFFGLAEKETPVGVTFYKAKEAPKRGTRLYVDISPYPDQFLTLGCLCIGLCLDFEATGAKYLRGKESDRIRAFQEGFTRLTVSPSVLEVKEDAVCAFPYALTEGSVLIDGCNDHRVVMSFAVLGASPLLPSDITISDPDAVRKSYPAFWDNLLSTINS